MEFLIGEPLALDLVNTRAQDFDVLDTPEVFGNWLDRQAGRLTSVRGPYTADDLGVVRELRAHVAAAVNAVRGGERPPGEAVGAINEAMRAAPAYGRLDVTDGGLTKGARRDGDRLARLLAQLAEAAADLLTDPAASRIRACEGPRCRMVFLPAHPRRRWCSPELCGNRVRVARHYQRHKTA
ncbi:CGNR zinc finger domain-containing protein [Nonomuraea sp. NPDC049758]|uniref:CGNR zinc finger domain-containing protein n=1 Tax=Nonomuraea sp. NPDC049758 TaxID=3154360 RepID=UPI0034173F97